MSFDGGGIRSEAELDLAQFKAAMSTLQGFTQQITRDLTQVPALKPVIPPAAEQGVKSFADRLREAIPLADNFGTSLRGSVPLLDQFGVVLKPTAAGLSAVAVGAAAAAAGFVLASKAAADLQHEVAFIKAIKPEIDTKATEDSLKNLSTTVAQSSTQLAAGLYNIFSSLNIGQEQAITLLAQLSKGAIAARTDTQTFGTAVIGVMNAYKLSVDQAEHVTDVFFNTVNAGVVTGAELSKNLGLVTQSAKAAGASVDELGAFIVAITKEGGDAAQNINNLNNLFLKLNTKEAAQDFAALGIEIADASGKLRSPLAVLTELKAKLDGMTDAARNLTLQQIFPDLQARAGIQVVLSQFDTLTAALKTNQEQVGSTREAYKTIAETATEQFTILQNTALALVQDIGTVVLPLAQGIVTALQGAVTSTRELVAQWQTAMAALGTNTQEGRDATKTALDKLVQDLTDAEVEIVARADAIAKALKRALTPAPPQEGGNPTATGGIVTGSPFDQPAPTFENTVGGQSILKWFQDAKNIYGREFDILGTIADIGFKRVTGGPDPETIAASEAKVAAWLHEINEIAIAQLGGAAAPIIEEFAAQLVAATDNQGAAAALASATAISEAFRDTLRAQFPGITDDAIDLFAIQMQKRAGDLREAGNTAARNAGDGFQSLLVRMTEVMVGIDELFAAVRSKNLDIAAVLVNPQSTETAINNALRLQDSLKGFDALMGQVADANIRAAATFLKNNGELEKANALLAAHKAASDASKEAQKAAADAAKQAAEDAKKAAEEVKKATEEATKLLEKRTEVEAKIPEILKQFNDAVNDAQRQLDDALAEIGRSLAKAEEDFAARTVEIQNTLDKARQDHARGMVELAAKEVESARATADKRAQIAADLAKASREAFQTLAEANTALLDKATDIGIALGKANTEALASFQEGQHDRLEKQTEAVEQAVERQRQAFRGLAQALASIRQQELQNAVQFSRALEDLELKTFQPQTQQSVSDLARERIRLQTDAALQQAGLTLQEQQARAQFAEAGTEGERAIQKLLKDNAKAAEKARKELQKTLQEAAERAADELQKAVEAQAKAAADAQKKLQEAGDKAAAELKKLAEEEDKRQRELQKQREDLDRKLDEQENTADKAFAKAQQEYGRRLEDLRRQQEKAQEKFARAIEKAFEDRDHRLADVQKELAKINTQLAAALQRMGIDMPLTFNNTTIQETGADFLRVASEKLEARLRQL